MDKLIMQLSHATHGERRK